MSVELRAASTAHPLDAVDRLVCGVMAGMGLWSHRVLAVEFGVNESTVRKHMSRYSDRWDRP